MYPGKLAAVAVIFLFFVAGTISASGTNSNELSSSSGALSGTNAGLTLIGSTLISVIGWNGKSALIADSFRKATLSSGGLTRGSWSLGGTFADGRPLGFDRNGSSELPNSSDTTIGYVPEPSSLALLSSGAIGLLGLGRRRLRAR